MSIAGYATVFEERRKESQDYPPRSSLISLLQKLQEEYHFLPEEKLQRVSEELRIPLSEVYGVATFFKSFSLVPQGQNVITVCSGTACHVRGSVRLVDDLERRLNIRPGQTTRDGCFTLETVNCLGCCALSPVMVVNGRYYGKMTSPRVGSLLNSIRSRYVKSSEGDPKEDEIRERRGTEIVQSVNISL